MSKDQILAQKELYKTHFEFLGYRIEEDPNDFQEFLARKDGDSTFVRVFSNGARIWANFRTNAIAQSDRMKFLEFINNVNDSLVIKAYTNSTGGVITFELMLLSPYDRTVFGTAVGLFSEQIGKVIQLPNADELLG